MVRYLTARAPGQARGEQRDGIEIVRRGGRFTLYPRALGWLIAHRRWPDAVLDCQNGIPFFTPLALPKRVPVLCVVHHVHTAQFGVHFPAWMAWVGRLLEGPASRLAYRKHGCVAVSPSTVSAMRDRLRWTGDIYLIPNGTPVPVASPGPGAGAPETVDREATRPQTAGQRPPLVWIGRLVAHKRAELIVPVAARGFTIDVIGRGPGATALLEAQSAAQREAPSEAQQALAADGSTASSTVDNAANNAGEIRLRGYVPEEDKQAIVAGSLVHLSTSAGEGWGLCVLEAAALGVPTVAYDVEGLRDAVRDGQTGWLVREGEELADVVERAVKELADPARRAEVAAACRHWAGQLSWDRSTARMAQLIAASVRLGTSRGTRDGAWVVARGSSGNRGTAPGSPGASVANEGGLVCENGAVFEATSGASESDLVCEAGEVAEADVAAGAGGAGGADGAGEGDGVGGSGRASGASGISEAAGISEAGEVVAEGPVLDVLLEAGWVLVRSATPAERLLGELSSAPGPS